MSHVDRLEALKAEQAKIREKWKASIEVAFAQRHAQYLNQLSRRDECLATANMFVASAKSQIKHHRETEHALTQQLADAATQIDQLTRELHEAAADRDQARGDLTVAGAERDQLQARLDSILKFDGRLWNLPVAAGVSVPPFRPIEERKTTIVSVLNFKGGVGKTSIAANLAGYFGQEQKRTLMIDLDYQRSLSQLALTDRVRNEFRQQQRCLQHFLAGVDHGFDRFREFLHRVEKGMGECWIVPNSNAAEVRAREESLDETENQMMAEWIVARDLKADIRYFLREALHDPKVADHFDYVFLDCPPRLSMSTINALAASDFVLVPVLLDDLSSNSIVPLVTALRDFRELFPQLKLLGIVANRARMYGGKPKLEQNEIWKSLKRTCRTLYKDYPVRFFETVIPESKAFGHSCGDAGPSLAIDEAAVFRVFKSLIEEIEEAVLAGSRPEGGTGASPHS